MQPTASILLGVLIVSSCASAQTSSGDVSSGDEASGDGDTPAQTTAPPSTTMTIPTPVVGCPGLLAIILLEISPCRVIERDVSECDIFTYVALTLTGRYLNRFVNCKFLSFTLEVSSQNNYINAVHEVLVDIPKKFRVPVYGIVGPPTTEEANILSPLVTKLFKRPMISYGASSDHLNGEEHKYLYTTIPTDSFLNRARIELMCRNNWRRIAVISSFDETQLQTSTDFLGLVSKSGMDICQFPTDVTVFHFGAYTTSPNTILKRLKENDLRIIFAFVEQERARDLICQASLVNLTLSSKYVWILPGYYNHEWWQSNLNTMCSDANVSAAARSVVFVDFNTLSIFQAGERLENVLDDYIAVINETFVRAFVNKTAPANVHRFLYHSRALRASDAMFAMVHAWELAILDLLRNYSLGFIYNTFSREHFVPDSDQMENIIVSKVQEKIRQCVFVGAAGIYHFSKRDKNLGEAMISQFSEGKECLFGILANTRLGIVTRKNQYRCLNTTDFDANNFTFVEGKEIQFNFSRHDSNIFVNHSQLIMEPCELQNFPIDGNCYAGECFCYSNVDGVFIVIVGGLTIVVVVTALLLLLINFILRNNKHVKASSPHMNAIIIIGCIVMSPCTVLVGIEHAGPAIGVREFLMQLLPPVCELRKWLFHIGLTTILATMLTRNWRLYRIFTNKHMSADLRFSSDRALVLIIALLLVPLLQILVISSAVDHYRYFETSTLDPCPNLGYDSSIRTFRNQSSCTASYEEVWEGIMLGYNALMCCFLLFFAYQIESRIKARHFQQEGEFAAKAVVLVFLFVFLGSVILFFLSQQRENINEYFWVNCVFVLGIPNAILLLLFVPKFVVVYLNQREAKDINKRSGIQKLLGEPTAVSSDENKSVFTSSTRLEN